MSKNWIMFDPISGAEFFETEKEAIDCAEEMIHDYRDDADEGWDDSVEDIVVAKVTHKIEGTEQEEVKEGEQGYGEFDFRQGFRLVSNIEVV